MFVRNSNCIRLTIFAIWFWNERVFPLLALGDEGGLSHWATSYNWKILFEWTFFFLLLAWVNTAYFKSSLESRKWRNLKSINSGLSKAEKKWRPFLLAYFLKYRNIRNLIWQKVGGTFLSIKMTLYVISTVNKILMIYIVARLFFCVCVRQ